MKKFFPIFLTILLTAGIVNSTLAQPTPNTAWRTYSNQKFGYKIQYPPAAIVESKGLGIRQKFYFDPLQPVTDLLGTPEFEKSSIYSDSIVQFSRPDKYVITLIFKPFSNHLLPPGAQPIVINHRTFYQKNSSEAGMCHQYEYNTYYLPVNDYYYVFIFLLTGGCGKQVQFDRNEVEKILASFQLL